MPRWYGQNGTHPDPRLNEGFTPVQMNRKFKTQTSVWRNRLVAFSGSMLIGRRCLEPTLFMQIE